MGTVEALQKRCHQGSQSEGEVLQRLEQDATRRLDHLRAELDEMYGQQIVQMKQELSARHQKEIANLLNQHSTELKNVSDQRDTEAERLTSQLTQSIGEVNALNVRVIELQQRLQEMQVLREKAEHDLTQRSEEQIVLQNRVQRLREDLRSKEQEKSPSEVHLQLHATITDLQAQLTSVQETSRELEAKHESEITNYQIKLEMLEREKDAVLDRMAESQEAELERLRTQLLFSHEEELSKLREDLQHESQINVGNLREELNQIHGESVQRLCSGYEDRIKVVEKERSVLAADRSALLLEIVALKSDLTQAMEKSQVEELVSQLQTLQAEVQDLRQSQGEKVKPQELYEKEVARESQRSWEELESENKLLKETNVTLKDELGSLEEDQKMLMKKLDTLISENMQANKMAEELRAETERQKSTFSFAEKNFEVNYQELRGELEERLRVQTLQYESKLRGLETQLQNLQADIKHESVQRMKEEEEEEEEPDRCTLVEKDTRELMEKLQSVTLERAGLLKQVEQKESEITELKRESITLEKEIRLKEVEFRRVEQEKTDLLEQVEQKEAKVKMVELERAGLVEQLGKKGMEVQRLELERAGLEEQTKLKDLEFKKVKLEKDELVQQVDQKEAELQQKEVELEKVNLEKAELFQQVEQKEAELQKVKLQKAKLVQQVEQKEVGLPQKEAELQGVTEKDTLLQAVEQKEVELQQAKERLQLGKPGKAELTDRVQGKKSGPKAAKKTRQKTSRVRGLESKTDIRRKGQPQIPFPDVEFHVEEAVKTEQILAPPLSQAEGEEKRASEKDVCVVHHNDGVKQQTHARNKIVAAAETHSHSRSRSHTHTHTQPAAAASHTARGNKPESDSEKQVRVVHVF